MVKCLLILFSWIWCWLPCFLEVPPYGTGSQAFLKYLSTVCLPFCWAYHNRRQRLIYWMTFCRLTGTIRSRLPMQQCTSSSRSSSDSSNSTSSSRFWRPCNSSNNSSDGIVNQGQNNHMQLIWPTWLACSSSNSISTSSNSSSSEVHHQQECPQLGVVTGSSSSNIC